MSTESTSVPSPSGPARGAGRAGARIAIAPPRGREAAHTAAGRSAAPPGRPPGLLPLGHALPLLLVDTTAALLGTAVSTAVLGDARRGLVLAVHLAACAVVLHARAGLYRPSVAPSALDQLPPLAARTAVAWCAAAAMLAALFPDGSMTPSALLCGAAAQLAATTGARGFVYGVSRAARRGRLRSALVVGSGPAAAKVAAALREHPEYGLRPVGIAVLGAQTHETVPDSAPGLPLLTTTDDVRRALVQGEVREAVFVGPPAAWSGPAGDESGAGPGDPGALAALLRAQGCSTLFVGEDAWPGGTRLRRMTDHLWGFAYRRFDPDPPHTQGPGIHVKRLLDIVVAALALVAVAPVLAGCALAVRLGDGPAVLFRQERVGQNGRLFTLLKFRTLRPADDHEAATRWNIAGDHRMSTVGRMLRRTSLDELPQLWNVLRGDMSLVGPRPERPHFVADFSKSLPGYAARHRMPVGITGLAQVHGLRGDTSIEDRSRFDNHYIDHWSLWQDVCILVRTAVSLVRPAGS